MWRDKGYLLDMLIAARDAMRFVEEITWEDFQRSALHQYAVSKALEIIGEAASKVSEKTKAQHSEIPWKEIVALRHRIVHDYFGLDPVRIWEIVRGDVPALMEQLENILADEEQGK